MNSLTLAIAVAVVSPAALAQVPVPVVLEGDTPFADGNVTLIQDLAVNDSGSWLVSFDTDHFFNTLSSGVLHDGTLIKREGDPVAAPVGAHVAEFTHLSLNDGGDVALSVVLGGISTVTDRGVYINDSLVLLEGDTISGETYEAFDACTLNDSGQVLLQGLVLNFTPFQPSESFVAVVDHDGAGSVTGQTLLGRTGTSLGGSAFVDSVPVRPESSALNDSGTYLFFYRSQPFSQWHLYKNGGPPRGSLPSGDVVNVGSGPGDNNASDSWAAIITAAPTTADPYTQRIVVDGAEILGVGDMPAAIAPHALTSFGFTVYLTDGGDVLWHGEWDDPDTSRNAGLFLGTTLIAQEGVTPIGGSLLESIDDNFTTSDSGRFVLFSGTLTGGVQGAFLLDLEAVTTFCSGDGSATACPCGNTGAAGHGCASSLHAEGALIEATGLASVSNDSLTLIGTNTSNAYVTYIQGSLQQNSGQGNLFGDGLRCAGGQVIRLGSVLAVDGASSYPGFLQFLVSIKGQIPAGGGVSRAYQVWYRNAQPFCTAATFNLTNGIWVAWSP